VPLAPVWVWLAFGETPAAATIAGGLAVIAAVIVNTLLSDPTDSSPIGGARVAARAGRHQAGAGRSSLYGARSSTSVRPSTTREMPTTSVAIAATGKPTAQTPRSPPPSKE
jgi:hypothetical protein